MSLFLIFYFLVYGGMNLYVGLKIRAGLRLSGWTTWLLAVFLLFMMLAPLLVRALERWGVSGPTRIIAFCGYFWIAISLWFCSLALILDLWNKTIRVLSLARPHRYALALPPPTALLVTALGVLLLAVLAWNENRGLTLRTVRLCSPRLPAGTRPLRLVQISDVHLGMPLSGRYFDQALGALARAQPDMVVSTGDLRDGTGGTPTARFAQRFAALQPPLGKFAVLGNHEFYAGVESSLAFIRACGFRVLRGEALVATGGPAPLLVAGIDDAAGIAMQVPVNRDENAILPRESDRPFTILLKHQPMIRPASADRFDLQLSGHTHGGQIFPFNLPVHLLYTYVSGLYRAGAGSIYVSRGTGSWGPPLRLLAPREIALFVIEPAEDDGKDSPKRTVHALQ
jgi:predicted MPP superfamily phosphohydrolase